MYLRTLICLLALSLASCGGETEAEKATREAEEAAQQMEEAVQNLQDALSGKENQGAKEVIDWRRLQEFLPKKIAGLPRIDESGETAGALGFTISQAKGTYEKDDKWAELQIMDTRGFGGLLSTAAAWSSVTIDREDRNGYERTTEINGYKAFEKYDKNRMTGEVNVLVGSRFVVSLKARGLKVDDLRDAVEDVGLKKLEKLD